MGPLDFKDLVDSKNIKEEESLDKGAASCDFITKLPLVEFGKKKIKMRNKKKIRMQNKSVCRRSANSYCKCVYKVVKRPDITMSTLKDFEPSDSY